MYYKPDGYETKKNATWYRSLLVIMLPLMIFSVVFNCLARFPDMYQWKITQNITAAQEGDENANTLESVGVFVTADEISNGISNYMRGKTEEISTLNEENEFYDYYKTKAAQFTQDDYEILNKAKMICNILLILGILSFLGNVFMYITLVKGGYATKAVLRKKFLISLIVMICIMLLLFVYGFIDPCHQFVNGTLLGLPAGELLPNILGANFMKNAVIFAEIGCGFLTLVFLYITWQCTKPRDIFNERRYFR